MLLSPEQGRLPERLQQLVRELRSIDHDPIIEGAFGSKGSEQIDRWLQAVLAKQEQYLRKRLKDEPYQDARDDLERLLVKTATVLNGELGRGNDG